MRRVILFTIIAALFGVYACEQYVIMPPEVDEVTYSGDIQPIFDSKCTSCHSTGGEAPDLTAGNSFAAIQAHNQGALLDLVTPENSLLLKQATNAHSYNAVSSGQAAKILKWIEDGALNN